MKKKWIFPVIITLVFLTTACAEAIPLDDCVPEQGFGFWSGLWHGLIAPFVFIWNLFTDEYLIYAVNNNGSWYDFGYLFGLTISLGSGGRASKK